MPLRIGFDLDGTLADMEAELIRQAEIVFGQPMTQRREEPAAPAAATADPPSAGAPEDAPENAAPLIKLRLTPRQQRRLWAHVESIENFWQTLRECEAGIVERLGRVAGERRWEIIFLTKRPEGAGATAQLQTQLWLESHGFHLPSVYVVQGSRGRIAAALGLDIVVDDRPENCLDVAVDSKARAVLIWREGAGQLPAAAQRLGIGVVKSVAECLDILIELDSPREEPGMLNRVKRMLGLKEPART
jgi:hypothetical protein